MIGAAKQWTLEKIGKVGVTVESDAFLALLKATNLTESTFVWVSKLAKPLLLLPVAQEKALKCEGDIFLATQVSAVKGSIKKYKTARLQRNVKATALGDLQAGKVSAKPEMLQEAAEAFKKADQAYRESRDACQAAMVQLERDRDKPFLDSMADMRKVLRGLRPAWNRPLVLGEEQKGVAVEPISPTSLLGERKVSGRGSLTSPKGASKSTFVPPSSEAFKPSPVILSQSFIYIEENGTKRRSMTVAASTSPLSAFKNMMKPNEGPPTAFVVLTTDQCALFTSKRDYPNGLIKSLPLKNALVHIRSDGFQIVDGADCIHNFTTMPSDGFDEAENIPVEIWMRQLCFVIPTKVFGAPLELAALRSKQEVPLPLLVATDWLNKHGLEEEGIYRIPGSKDEVERMIKQFDRNQEVVIPDQYFGGNVASLIVQFIRRLPESIYTEKLGGVFQQVSNDATLTETNCALMLKKLVGMLPPVNSATLRVLVRHLKLVAENEEKNQMSAGKLAMCIMSDNARSLQLLIERHDQIFTP
jgi:hypothetical protein